MSEARIYLLNCWAFLFLLKFARTGSRTCDLHVLLSKRLGLGLFSGKVFDAGDVAQVVPGIPVPVQILRSTDLIDFCEGYNSSHGMILLGYGMLFNHASDMDEIMLRKLESVQKPLLRIAGFDSVDVIHEIISVVDFGRQIFSHYGGDWFDSRGMRELSRSDICDASENGECASTNIDSDPRLLPGCPTETLKIVDSKLIAALPIKKGEVIEVVRAFHLSAAYFAHPSAGLIRYLLWWPPIENASHLDMDSLVEDDHRVLLFTGYGSLYGASRNSCGSAVEPANVGYGRWNFPQEKQILNTDRVDRSSIHFNIAAGEIEREKNVSDGMERAASIDEDGTASSDQRNSYAVHNLLVAFTALEDIQPETELRVDLYRDCTSGLRYIDKSDFE